MGHSGQEGTIRKKIIENDLVDCILSMPTNLFYTVTVPCSIWIINRNKKQKNKTLFINANNLGSMVTRKLRELSETDIRKIADTYHRYQNDDNYEIPRLNVSHGMETWKLGLRLLLGN